MVEGVIIEPLKQIADERGKVMHMLRADSPLFTQFGEVYFSVVNPGHIKAWKKHTKMIQQITVPIGKVRLVIYDIRSDSTSYKNFEIIEFGEDNYCLIRIPPLVWYGFKGISSQPSLIACITDIPHDPSEKEQRFFHDKTIPYEW